MIDNQQDNQQGAKLTQLLLSVRDEREARLAASHPIGILDVKEPNRGALGGATPETLRRIGNVAFPEREQGETMEARNGLRSFAAGELSDWMAMGQTVTDELLREHYGLEVLEKYQFIKIGLAGLGGHADWGRNWSDFFSGLPESASPVAVAYFDYQNCDAISPDRVIAFAASQPRCRTVLFDTFQKSEPLFGYCSPRELSQWVEQTQAMGMKAVVAGSVNRSCLAQVLAVGPDYVGVRGAVCLGSRSGPIDERLLEELLATIDE